MTMDRYWADFSTTGVVVCSNSFRAVAYAVVDHLHKLGLTREYAWELIANHATHVYDIDMFDIVKNPEKTPVIKAL